MAKDFPVLHLGQDNENTHSASRIGAMGHPKCGDGQGDQIGTHQCGDGAPTL